MSVKVDIKYNDVTIGSLTSSDVLICDTADKYIEKDIKVEFTGTEDATADASKILSGYSAYISDGSKADGTMQEWNGEKVPDYLCFTANTSGSTVSMSVTGTPTLGLNFLYSTNRHNWNEFIPGTTTVTLASAGDKVYFKGNNPNGICESTSIYYKFRVTGSIAASGNIMSLIDNGACTSVTIPNDYCLYSLFLGCYYLTTAPQLPATTITYDCYTYMFSDCVSLTTAPDLPATTLADGCYQYMFYNCVALTTAPQLPATTLTNYCYYNMFNYCTALTGAPELPSTNLARKCYELMFANCTTLTTAPALPATTLADYCYTNMFSGCRALTTAPALPATELLYQCYYAMFYGCTSLQVSDTQTSEATYAWILPTEGTFRYNSTQSYIFLNCAGTRSTDSPTFAAGQSYTYYTQNAPV